MILTPLADTARYHALHPLFARAFTWLRAGGVDALSPDRYDLGDGLHAIVDHGTTRDAVAARLESHRAHIDIQVNLSGGERMEWAPVAGLAVETPFADDGDIAFYRQPAAMASFVVAPRWAAIFWPQDAHKPICHVAVTPTAYRKVVIKVPVLIG